jgi:glycosyltransferase involved in cell wall biosynthesis
LAASALAPKPPLRICLFTPELPPEDVGGIGSHTRALANALSDLGHEVFVVVGRHETASPREESFNLIEIRRPRQLRLLSPLVFAWAMSRHLRALTRDLNFDVIEAPEYGAATAFLRTTRPVVVRLHSGSRLNQRFRRAGLRTRLAAKAAGLLETIAIRRADFITSPSTVIAAEETTRGHRVIPNLSSSSQAHVSGEERGGHVVFLGRYERRKGADTFAIAACRVLEVLPNVRITFAGPDTFDGPGGQSMRHHCRTVLRAYEDRIALLGSITSEEVSKLLSSAAVLAVPSRLEAFGMVYIEAMSAGAVPIGCLGTGAEEVITDGITGLLVPPGDAPALADALIGLLTHERSLRDMAERGRHEVAIRFNEQMIAATYDEFYRSLSMT